MITNCRCCGKELTDPSSVALGIGPVCRAAELVREAAQDDLFLAPIPCEPVTHDFVLFRDEAGEPQTNVPRTVIHHSPTGFNWGYAGSGPADLALNILNAVFPPTCGDKGALPCYRGICSAVAWDLHQDFKRAFLSASIPVEGGVIKSADVRAWVEKEIQKEVPCFKLGVGS